MIDFENLFPENLYHSYVIEGDPDNLSYLLRDFLESRGEINQNSGDVVLNLYDSFVISDIEKIKEWHQNKSIEGKKKVYILGAKFINREAEQALLKIIEEPNTDTHFFIVVPDSSLLLGTILSRVHLLKNVGSDTKIEDEIAEKFMKSTPSVRIEKVADIIKEFKDNDNSGGLRSSAISLINGVERIIYKKWKEDINNDNLKFVLNELKNCRSYLSTPGSSVKMILEHIALMI